MGGGGDSVYLLIIIITLHLARLSLVPLMASASFCVLSFILLSAVLRTSMEICLYLDVAQRIDFFFYLCVCHIWVNSRLKWCHLSTDCLLLVEGNINALLLVFQFTRITADTF